VNLAKAKLINPFHDAMANMADCPITDIPQRYTSKKPGRDCQFKHSASISILNSPLQLSWLLAAAKNPIQLQVSREILSAEQTQDPTDFNRLLRSLRVAGVPKNGCFNKKKLLVVAWVFTMEA